MREHEINKLDNFIGGWYLDDTSICDKIIDFHRNSPDQYQGITGGGYTQDKNSVDVILQSNPDLTKEYVTGSLQPVINEYIKKYPWCNAYEPWMITEGINIQYYPKGGGFYSWHSERTNNVTPYAFRHLVFLTYLNDVTEDGETEFFHQKLKVKPEKGLTLVWGVDWTFTHRGIPSFTQEKYVATGWFSLVDRDQWKQVNQ